MRGGKRQRKKVARLLLDHTQEHIKHDSQCPTCGYDSEYVHEDYPQNSRIANVGYGYEGTRYWDVLVKCPMCKTKYAFSDSN